MEEHRYAQYVRHSTLGGLSDVVSDGVVNHLRFALSVKDNVALGVLLLVLDPVFVKPFYRVDVGEPEEGARGRLEIGVQLLDERGGVGVREQLVDGLADL